jgi:hypothetical protein
VIIEKAAILERDRLKPRADCRLESFIFGHPVRKNDFGKIDRCIRVALPSRRDPPPLLPSPPLSLSLSLSIAKATAVSRSVYMREAIVRRVHSECAVRICTSG